MKAFFIIILLTTAEETKTKLNYVIKIIDKSFNSRSNIFKSALSLMLTVQPRVFYLDTNQFENSIKIKLALERIVAASNKYTF